MFFLKKKIVGGYKFREKTFYSKEHLGVDWKAVYVIGYSPFNGNVIKTFTAPQGGLSMWYKPDHDNVIMRFLHLDKVYIKNGKVTKGQKLFKTGKSGIVAGKKMKPHVHNDISKNRVDIYDINNFIDPEKYDWDFNPNKLMKTTRDNRICQIKNGAIYIKDRDVKKYYIVPDTIPEEIRFLLSLHKGEEKFYKKSDFDGLKQVNSLNEVL